MLSCIIIFFFFRILSHFYVGSMFLMRRFHLTRFCASSPDSFLSNKSFLMLSNHLEFRSSSPSFPAPPSPSLSCLRIRLVFSTHAHTTSTYFIPCQIIRFLAIFPRTSSDSFEIWHTCRNCLENNMRKFFFYLGQARSEIWPCEKMEK